MKRRRFLSTCIGGIAGVVGACLGIKGQPLKPVLGESVYRVHVRGECLVIEGENDLAAYNEASMLKYHADSMLAVHQQHQDTRKEAVG